MEPYKSISGHSRNPNRALSSSPATTVFYGLWRAIQARDFNYLLISFAGILSKIIPVLLSNTPYRVTQTWKTHVICAWMAVTILVFMILVLLGSFFFKLPYMPVDPSTIAGSIYYVCDSPILGDFENLSTIDKKERNALIKTSGAKYRFGKMIGISGRSRIGVTYDGKQEI